MKEEKKSNSFLFTLYDKYVKKESQTKAPAEATAAQLVEETLQEIQTPAFPPEKQYLQALYDLYLFFHKEGVLSGERQDKQSFEAWLLAPVQALPDFALRRAGIMAFEKTLSAEAAGRLREIIDRQQKDQETDAEPRDQAAQDDEADQAAAVQEPAAAPEAQQPTPLDAVCKTYIAGNQMSAYLFAIPPLHGGRPLDEENLLDCLEGAGIVSGLDKDCLAQLVQEQRYLQIFPVAQGTPAVDGKDGEVIPQLEFSSEIEIRQDERGISDFKNINAIHCLSKDQVICAIIPPEEGVAGQDVKGKVLPARVGKPAKEPSGKNTHYSADKSRLLASVDGQITEKDGRYHVEPVLVIAGNVDYSVGNVYFNGDVVIHGDVCNGFTVKAEGGVTVRGMVESADIISGGDVLIYKGMNGNFSGFIEAKGAVKASFLENCTVYCEGELHADSIIAGKIFCGASVHVLTKHGAIIGGTITAAHSVEAKVIGSQSRRETDIVLGELPRVSEKRAQAENELKSVEVLLDKMNKNLSFLADKKVSLPPDKLEMFEQLQLQRTLYAGRREELTVFLAELAEAQRDFSACRVKCEQLYPPTKVTIGSEYTIYKENATKCLIYRDEGGIVMGSL